MWKGCVFLFVSELAGKCKVRGWWTILSEKEPLLTPQPVFGCTIDVFDSLENGITTENH